MSDVDAMVGYNEDEVEMINYVRQLGTRGVGAFSSAEGSYVSEDDAAHLVPAKS
jgi:hypothetical protein